MPRGGKRPGAGRKPAAAPPQPVKATPPAVLAKVAEEGITLERTIRELSLGSGGIVVGKPLRDFHGVLSGTPTYRGPDGDISGSKHE